MNTFKWIQDWYSQQCDGEWEHEYGIKIATVDNPGWSVVIDLRFTILENKYIEYQLFENGGNDWYGYSIKKGVFSAVGDPQKLEHILNIFKKLIEDKDIDN